MSEEQANAGESKRRRPLFATVIPVLLILWGLAVLAVNGIYGLEIRSGRLIVRVPFSWTVTNLLVNILIAWAFWTMRSWAGKLLTVCVWVAVAATTAVFLFQAKPSPEEVWRVSIWWLLPPALIAVVVTIFVAKRREVFEQWAEK